MKGSKLILAIAMAVTLSPVASLLAQAPPPPVTTAPATPAPAAVQPVAVQPAAPAQPVAAAQPPVVDIDQLVQAIQGLQGMAQIAFKAADVNNDNQISQQEAIDAVNAVAGGIFFRADLDGNGTITDQEARQAINQVLQRQPVLRFVIERARTTPEAAQRPDAVRTIISLLDANNDNQVTATEVRTFVQTMVQGFFATADTNRDGQLSIAELQNSVRTTARTVAQAIFNAADTDHNGGISQEEFRRALEEPANAAFRVIDANNDGQISQQEADSALRILIQELQRLNVPAQTRAARGAATSPR